VTAHRQRGAKGEAVAARALAEAGFGVVERNWRSRFGEVDLVARRDDLLLFVEVKARRSDRYGVGAAAVTPAKQKKLAHAAKAYLARHAHGRERIRFDVIEVAAPDGAPWYVQAWIKGAFWVDD